MSKKPGAEKTSWGTAVAEKERAKANAFSDEKRQQLLGRALQLIYEEPAHARRASHRRGH